MNLDFGHKHLFGLAWLTVLIITLLVILLYLRKRFKLTENYDRAVIRYTCYFLWALEIIKTIRMVNYDDFGPVGYYPLWMAPFHICSMALYVYPIVASKHPGKLSKLLTPFAYAVMLAATSIILIIPASSGILGNVENWSFCFDNILPYQSWLYHGSLAFVSVYMVLSGFYKPRWKDIYISNIALLFVAACAQILNYVFDGSGADYMTLRYGNGNPFAFLLADSPVSYYLVLAAVTISTVSLLIAITIGIRKIFEMRRKQL